MADPLPTYKEVSYNIRCQGRTRYNRADLGDGYTQIAADGINANERNWQLELRNLTDTYLQNYVVFFEGRLGDSFTWTPKGDTVNQKWLYLDYDYYPVADNMWTMVVNIEKDFRLY